MKKILKILAITFSILLTIFIVFSIIFIRFDIDKTTLEEKYFLEDSHYLDVTIKDLDNQDISTTIHYQDKGSLEDDVVLLIHGTFSSSHTFIPWAEELIKNDYRVIMVDLPYFGLSEGFDDLITSYRRHAEVIKYLLDELSISSIHIAGNSLGGGVAWYFTSEYENMVQTLTLIDAVYPDGERQDSGLFAMIDNLNFLVPLFSLYTPKFLMESILSSAYGDPDNINEETLTRYYELLRKENTRQNILSLKEEAEPDISYIDRLNAITKPTYLMWGELDSWIPVETAYLFQETMDIDESHIFIYSDLGHVPMEEDPETTVEDFLEIIENY